MVNFYVNLNKKYNYYYNYDKKTGNIIDYEQNIIPKDHIIYKIIEKYNDIIKYLDNIKIIPNKSIKEADDGLVYKGIDKKGKEQYRYGINYIFSRRKEKLETFLKVYNKMDIIEDIIKKGLKEDKINKSFIFSSILLLELTYYIRLGKMIYLKENETVGLLTLKKKNLLKEDDNIFIIKFVGKIKKEYAFKCYKEMNPILFNVLEKLNNHIKNENDFIFTSEDNKVFTEKMLNDRLKKINLTIKDFRTYGTNIVFLKRIYENFKDDTNINYKKLIRKSIEETSNIIGHTKGISKKSYLSDELEEIIPLLADEIVNLSFENFLNSIINKLRKNVIQSSSKKK